MAVDGPVGDYDNDDEYAEVLYLDPPAYTRGDKAKWKASGRVFRAAASAVSGEIVGWTTKEVSSPPGTASDNQQSGDDKPTQAGAGAASAAAAQPTVGDRVIHVASINAFAASEQRMYAETYTLFLSLQKIVASAIRLPDTNDVEMWDPAGGILESLLGPPSAETVSHMNRLVSMYLEEVSKLRTADGLDVS
jgi:nuclear pore complex protein Nup85